MSATSEDRWRPRGQQNPSVQNQNLNQNLNQQPHQQRQQTSRTSSGTAHGKQNSADAGLVAVPRILHTSVESGARDGSSYGPPPDQHVPVRGFNSLEVRDMLKKAYDNAVTEAGRLVKYKPSGGQANSAKSGGPWGTKPNTTANGKDFFLELRKQFSALQQGGGERAGG